MNTDKKNKFNDRRAIKVLVRNRAIKTLFETSRSPEDYRDGFAMGYFMGKLQGTFEGKWKEIESWKRREK